MDFEKELQALINRHSQESGSNTPDFILAQYVATSLAGFNVAVQQRESWYGRDPRPSQPVGGNKTGVSLIADERKRQIEAEGFDAAHDAGHDLGDLISAATAYAMSANAVDVSEHLSAKRMWPWPDGFKPRDAESNLVRAGALIAASIDRLRDIRRS